MRDEPLVLVVDDDAGMRESVTFLLASVGLDCHCFASAREFLDWDAANPPTRPGCVLLDIRMPGLSGLEAMRQLRERHHPLPLVIVTGHADVALAVAAMKAGAADFIEKPYNDHAMLDIVNAAIERGREALAQRAETDMIRARLSRLSRREREVLALVLEGKQNKEIAAALSISIKTVEGHRQMVMEKTRARSVAELSRMTLALPDWADGA